MAGASVFTSAQRALLRAVLNRIIPAEGNLPGAGAVGVDETIERATLTSAVLRRTLLDGLAAIEVTAWRTGGNDFITLPEASQDETLRQVERAQASFFGQLVVLAYRGYYLQPRIVQLVGMETRFPQPEGFVLPTFDPRLLDKVKARGPIYRPTEGP